MSKDARVVRKGTNPDVDSYSAFFDNLGSGGGDTGLREMLSSDGVEAVFVAGLATDYCVGSTALHALSDRVGSLALLVDDASRGVDVASIEAMRRRLLEAGGILADTHGVEELLLAAKDREEKTAAATAATAAGETKLSKGAWIVFMTIFAYLMRT